MTENQIVEINKNNIEIGSHTLSHPDLAVATDTKARREIFDSKASLEKMISKKVISFCYPSGKYTATTEALVKEAGYAFAVTTNGGITTFEDLYALNRHRINNGTSISGWIK
jgi:peptidoglycan/xylan/chitin deacetylase (PgdA/CDA1 family)